MNMIEKLIEELDGKVSLVLCELGTLICNEFGIPEYMVFREGVVEDGDTDKG